MPISPSHIAVLGGGITGLSSAFHLSRRFPAARISLIEQSFRLGGWLRSERVSLQDGSSQNDPKSTSLRANSTGTVLLEAGPRTLRPNYDAILELVSETTSSSSYIYLASEKDD
jgi:protoporphyrinogen/coproporphyrinogen III oxidase